MFALFLFELLTIAAMALSFQPPRNRLLLHGKALRRRNVILDAMKRFYILGGSGDLATSKLLPALFSLFAPNDVSDDIDENYNLMSVVCIGRSPLNTNRFRERVANSIRKSGQLKELEQRLSTLDSTCDLVLSSFLERCSYRQVESYSFTNSEHLADTITQHGIDKDDRNIIYFALPPNRFLSMLESMKHALARSRSQGGNRHSRIPTHSLDIVIEKPVGSDSFTAKQIINAATQVLPASCIWFVDHYLCKDIATRILPTRVFARQLKNLSPSFASSSRSSAATAASCTDSDTSTTITTASNTIGAFTLPQQQLLRLLFDDLWNTRHISDIEIEFRDTSTLDGRSGYFDDYGIIRDITQNHLVQLLALVLADLSNGSFNGTTTTSTPSSATSTPPITGINNSNHSSSSWLPLELLSMDQSSRDATISKLKEEALLRLQPLRPDQIVLGQYDTYQSEHGVKNNSRTATFAYCSTKPCESSAKPIESSTKSSESSTIPPTSSRLWDRTDFHLLAGKGLADPKHSLVRLNYREEAADKVLALLATETTDVLVSNVTKPLLSSLLGSRRRRRRSTATSTVATAATPTTATTDNVRVSLLLMVQPNPGVYLEVRRHRHQQQPQQQQSQLLQPPQEKQGTTSTTNCTTATDVEIEAERRYLLWTPEQLPIWNDLTTTTADTTSPPSTVISDIGSTTRGSTGTGTAVRVEEAYVRLLRSVLRHEREYFPSVGEITAQWRLFDDVMHVLEDDRAHDTGDHNDTGSLVVKYTVGSNPRF